MKYKVIKTCNEILERRKFNFDTRKYIALLNTSYKDEMLSKIKNDLIKYYPKMNEMEQNALSTSIYISCTLMCYNIDIFTILDFVQFVDNYYYFKNGKSEIESAITDATSFHLKTIQQKYVNEIKKQL